MPRWCGRSQEFTCGRWTSRYVSSRSGSTSAAILHTRSSPRQLWCTAFPLVTRDRKIRGSRIVPLAETSVVLAPCSPAQSWRRRSGGRIHGKVLAEQKAKRKVERRYQPRRRQRPLVLTTHRRTRCWAERPVWRRAWSRRHRRAGGMGGGGGTADRICHPYPTSRLGAIT
jgi:hypothetical protein